MIRHCSKAECLAVLQHPSVCKWLEKYPVDLVDYVETVMVDERLAALIVPRGEEVEVHIGCRLRDRAFLRESLQEGMAWLKARGFKRAYTTAPSHRTGLINLLKSLGFVLINDRWVFSWEWTR